jgi:phospholipid/cholesterol/gamma-HCH transport system permease protein
VLRMQPLVMLLSRIEAFFASLFYISGQMILLFTQSIAELRFAIRSANRVLKQMLEIGYNTLPLAGMIGLFTGMIVALQTGIELKKLSIQQVIGGIVGLSLVREMGPVITAFIIAGRVGAAMAAELGTMAVSEEIDALRAMGINPVRYLVMPRFLASVTMQPILTVYAIVIGIWGGGLISSTYLGIDRIIYYNQLYRTLEVSDITKGLSKTLIFAAIYSIVCCYMGMSAENGAAGVGKSTTRAVVISLTMILIADYFMSRFAG